MIRLCILLVATVSLLSCVCAHGTMKSPRERGSLNNKQFGSFGVEGLAIDYCHHCNNGGGVNGVKKHMTGNWNEWDPMNKAAPFRHDAGLCGDPFSDVPPRAHEKGGIFGPPKSMPYSAVYEMGETVTFEIAMGTNHDGYFSYYVCDVTKCGGDVSELCFKGGHCRQLFRAKEPDCEAANTKRCAPIDPDFPGRWYTPKGHKATMSMKYKLPEDFKCKDCVVIWYWATANSCFEKGVKEYYQKYPQFNEQGQVIINRCVTSPPEEFWNCADVRITGPGVPAPAIMPPGVAYAEGDSDGNESMEMSNMPKYEANDEMDQAAKEVPEEMDSKKTVSSETNNENPIAMDSKEEIPMDTYKEEPMALNTKKAVSEAAPVPTRTPEPETKASVSDAELSGCTLNDTYVEEAKAQANGNDGCKPKWKQCGGNGYNGPTNCCASLKCVTFNQHYSQCQPYSM